MASSLLMAMSTFTNLWDSLLISSFFSARHALRHLRSFLPSKSTMLFWKEEGGREEEDEEGGIGRRREG